MDFHKENSMSRRVCILLMDSFGIGASADAKRYQDQGANTFGHILMACRDGSLSRADLNLPHLAKRGLYHAAIASSGEPLVNLASFGDPEAYYGYAVEQSYGKDTPSGHWELAGVPVLFDWGYFPNTMNCFPKALIDALIHRSNLPGVLGEKHASGTEIIEELGALHCQTGKPIVYTSADSVFQIAAHEETFGLDRLYRLCEIARELVDDYAIGRVIARPFVGTSGCFKRTANRRDYSIPPPEKTLLDYLKDAGREVIAIGKVSDIFAHQGVTQSIKGDGNQDLFHKTIEAMKTAPSGSLIFTNFVDFDSSYGHRRDVLGYANALEAFDAQLPLLGEVLKSGDMVIIASDHGCDPTFPGSDHTREHIPVLAFGPGLQGGFIGRRETFADVGQSIAEYLGLTPLSHGVSFLSM
jgi:phosphopentomutase